MIRSTIETSLLKLIETFPVVTIGDIASGNISTSNCL